MRITEILRSPPDDKTGNGRSSLKEGFPFETQLPLTNGGIAPSRLDFNGAFNLLSAFTFWQQSGGLFPYDAELNYQPPAMVVSGGELWWCVAPSGPAISTGASRPGTNAAYWRKFSDFLGVRAIPTAGAASPTIDGNPAGIVTLARDNDTTSRNKAATPAGMAAQIAGQIAGLDIPSLSYGRGGTGGYDGGFWMQLGPIIFNWGNTGPYVNGIFELEFGKPYTFAYSVLFGAELGGTAENPNGVGDAHLQAVVNNSKTLTGCQLRSWSPNGAVGDQNWECYLAIGI